MYPANVSGMFTGDALVSYWPIFSLSLPTIPDVFVKVNLLKLLFVFVEWSIVILRTESHNPLAPGYWT